MAIMEGLQEVDEAEGTTTKRVAFNKLKGGQA
jgi:hypothetical protein